MSWLIHDGEFKSVIKLEAPRRYDYFVKKVADHEEIWSLSGPSGWLLVGNPDNQECIPVWPHAKYAETFAAAQNDVGYVAKVIDLTTFRNRWIPGMERDHRLVAVFPTPSLSGVVVAPNRLKSDIDAECARME